MDETQLVQWLDAFPRRNLKELECGLFTVGFAPLPDGLNGYVKLDAVPFRITVSNTIVPMRQDLALVHELLHVGTHFLKLKVPHDHLHQLAVFVLTQIAPALAEFRKQVR